MPFKWEKGRNPYVSNHFGTLQIGPNAPHIQIIAKARDLVQKMAAGQVAKSASGHELDQHAVDEASVKLRDPRSAAEELLLVHPQPQSDERTRLKTLIEELRKRAELPAERPPLPLRHPLSVFWFIPSPGPDAAELPNWQELGLVGASDPSDMALDIIFDS